MRIRRAAAAALASVCAVSTLLASTSGVAVADVSQAPVLWNNLPAGWSVQQISGVWKIVLPSGGAWSLPGDAWVWEDHGHWVVAGASPNDGFYVLDSSGDQVSSTDADIADSLHELEARVQNEISIDGASSLSAEEQAAWDEIVTIEDSWSTAAVAAGETVAAAVDDSGWQNFLVNTGLTTTGIGAACAASLTCPAGLAIGAGYLSYWGTTKFLDWAFGSNGDNRVKGTPIPGSPLEWASGSPPTSGYGTQSFGVFSNVQQPADINAYTAAECKGPSGFDQTTDGSVTDIGGTHQNVDGTYVAVTYTSNWCSGTGQYLHDWKLLQQTPGGMTVNGYTFSPPPVFDGTNQGPWKWSGTITEPAGAPSALYIEGTNGASTAEYDGPQLTFTNGSWTGSFSWSTGGPWIQGLRLFQTSFSSGVADFNASSPVTAGSGTPLVDWQYVPPAPWTIVPHVKCLASDGTYVTVDGNPVSLGTPTANQTVNLTVPACPVGDAPTVGYATGGQTGNDPTTQVVAAKPVTYPSNGTGTQTDPSASPSPAPGGTSLPSTGTNPSTGDTGSDNCMGAFWSWNPVDWVYVPVKCALQWAFVPSTTALQADAQEVQTDFNNSAIGVVSTGFGDVVGAVENLVDTSGDCSGPELPAIPQIALNSPTHPFDACSDPMATWATFFHTTLTLFVYVAAAMVAFNIIAAAFGWDVRVGRGLHGGSSGTGAS